jgi:Outer membrane protein beta-barrel domain
MKSVMKKFSLLIICLIVSWCTFAQTEYGIKGGLNYSYMIGDYTKNVLTIVDGGKKAEAKFMPGFHGGFYARMPISEILYFQPELLVSEKGVMHKVTDVTRVGNATEELTVRYFNEFVYTDVNLLLGVGNANWRLTFGPQIGYLLDARRRVENEIQNLNTIDYFANAEPLLRKDLAASLANQPGIDPAQIPALVEEGIGQFRGNILYKKRKPSLGLVLGMAYEFDFGLNVGLTGEFQLLNPYKLEYGGELKKSIDSGQVQVVSIGNTQLFNTVNFQLSVGYTLKPHKIYKLSHRGR